MTNIFKKHDILVNLTKEVEIYVDGKRIEDVHSLVPIARCKNFVALAIYKRKNNEKVFGKKWKPKLKYTILRIKQFKIDCALWEKPLVVSGG